MSRTSGLISFVRSLPIGPAYAPIYAEGVVFGKSESVSSGKAPHELSHHRVFSPEDVALLLEQQPDTFQAIGLFTGIRSDGIVILDVDANLSTLQEVGRLDCAGAQGDQHQVQRSEVCVSRTSGTEVVGQGPNA